MTQPLTRWVLRLLSLLLTFLLAIGVFAVVKDRGWLSPWAIKSESHDSQVIRAIERTQEVSLVSLGIQGIEDKHQSRTIFGKSIPGTGDTVFLEYSFHAKLGIDGARVKVTKTGTHAYLISVPKFKFIGYDKPTFKVAVEDGGVLDFATPEVDKIQMVNEVLSEQKQERYVRSYEALLRDQTEVFYNRLITSIDPTVTTSFEFRF